MRTFQLTLAFILATSSANAASIPALFRGTYADTHKLCHIYQKKAASVFRNDKHQYLVVTEYGFSTAWEDAGSVRHRGPKVFEAVVDGTPATRSNYLLDFSEVGKLKIALMGGDGWSTMIRCKDPA